MPEKTLKELQEEAKNCVATISKDKFLEVCAQKMHDGAFGMLIEKNPLLILACTSFVMDLTKEFFFEKYKEKTEEAETEES